MFRNSLKTYNFAIMSTVINLNDILTKVQKLDKEQKLTLLERLVVIIKKEDVSLKTSKLSTISGVGANIWKSVDIDEYIENERQW